MFLSLIRSHFCSHSLDLSFDTIDNRFLRNKTWVEFEFTLELRGEWREGKATRLHSTSLTLLGVRALLKRGSDWPSVTAPLMSAVIAITTSDDFTDRWYRALLRHRQLINELMNTSTDVWIRDANNWFAGLALRNNYLLPSCSSAVHQSISCASLAWDECQLAVC